MTDLLSDDEIKALKDMEAEASPGPWAKDMRNWIGRPSQNLYISGDAYADSAGELCATGIAIVTCPEAGSIAGNANADLITALRNAFPKLIAAHERCEAVRKLAMGLQHSDRSCSLEAQGFDQTECDEIIERETISRRILAALSGTTP